MAPVTRNDIAAKRVIELGCGNASLLVHMAEWGPVYLEGVDLGDSVLSAEKNMATVDSRNWKVTKGDLVEFVATPLAVPFYLYAKLIALSPRNGFTKKMPLSEYMLWISRREFAFFRHVAFDQLVTPQTTYISKQTLENWLASHAEIDPASTYITMRNGNSWKFGGKLR